MQAHIRALVSGSSGEGHRKQLWFKGKASFYLLQWWFLPVVLALGQRQEDDSNLQAKLVYRVSSKPGVHSKTLSQNYVGSEQTTWDP